MENNEDAPKMSLGDVLDMVIEGDLITRYEVYGNVNIDDDGMFECQETGAPISQNLRRPESDEEYVLSVNGHRGDYPYMVDLYADAVAALRAQSSNEFERKLLDAFDSHRQGNETKAFQLIEQLLSDEKQPA